MKKVGWILLCAVVLCCCTGCRDREENHDLTVVAGIAVDGKNGDYHLVTETLTAGGEQEGGKRLLTPSSGMTLNGALLETANLTAQQLYYTHAQTLVVSRGLAEESLEPLLQALERQNSFRLSLRLVVAQEDAAGLLSLQEPQNNAASFQLRSMADTSWHNATSPDTPLYRFLADAGEPGVQGILPLAGLRKEGRGEAQKQAPEILGTALFRDYTLVDTLDDRESQALLWMRESANGGLLEDENLALTVVGCRSRLQCDPQGAHIRLTLELQALEGSNGKDLEQRAEALAEQRCRQVLERLQELNCDAIGLGKRLMQRYPSETESVKTGWSQRFPSYPVAITVEAKLRDQGRVKEDVR